MVKVHESQTYDIIGNVENDNKVLTEGDNSSAHK